MQISLKLFARARDLAGVERAVLEVPDLGRVRDLKNCLAARFPPLAPLVDKLLVAVGNDYAHDDFLLSPGADVACFPPVSGG